MIISHFPGGGKDIGTPFYEIISYSGNATYIDDGKGNWRVKFLSSGELIPQEDVTVDIFAVGGGGNGGDAQNNQAGAGGGGGGYTKTERFKKLEAGKRYTVTVGAACGSSSLVDSDGVVYCEAAGGESSVTTSSKSNGGSGGSGGGPGAYASRSTGHPGSDGNSGTNTDTGTSVQALGGTGQGTTTREFGESTGDLYAGGGGGGSSGGSYSGVNRPGADGGGGNGGDKTTAATPGGENTGGGGGGGPGVSSSLRMGASGGSGIVIIRNARVN